MKLFDTVNGLSILKEFNAYCNGHPHCAYCPLYAKPVEACAVEMGVANRTVWIKKMEDEIQSKFEKLEE